MLLHNLIHFHVYLQVTALVEETTREQAKCGKWFSFRAGRITASNAKAVSRTSTTDPSKSLIARICYPEENQFWSPQTAWGKQHEQKAREAYKSAARTIHTNFQCRESGLHISVDHPFLAASPDGVVSCTCCGDGVLEIKCPYNGREGPTRQLAAAKSSCITLVDGKFKLNTDHAYYYQVQMQMLVCKAAYCDFVLWTLQDFANLRVYKDTEFCKNMVERCERYFRLVVLPELCFLYWTNAQDKETQEHPAGTPSTQQDENAQPSEGDKLYCLCEGPESGKMIMCDSKTCKHTWFHYKCVNIKRAPKKKVVLPRVHGSRQKSVKVENGSFTCRSSVVK